MYIKREIETEIKTLAKEFPIVAIMGPRQSGKTTLARHLFSKYKYISLEDPDIRNQAIADPRGMLADFGTNIILDEIQKVPELFSYLQTASDEHNISGSYILTGSENYLLSEKIAQSLAGRVGITTLLPLSLNEIKAKFNIENLNEVLVKGFYPRIFDKDIRPSSFYSSYIDTYLERDIRLIKNISKFDSFHKFLRVIAARNGQVLNTLTISNECDVAHNTIKDWINLLERSYIIFKLRPYHKNFNKRIVKKSKIYFYDTGLLCYLLNIKNTDHLIGHPFRGEIFEAMVISELIKDNLNNARGRAFYFWRDKQQREIDLIIEDGPIIKTVEIKSTQTIRDNFFKHLSYFDGLSGNTTEPFLIYAGPHEIEIKETKVLRWLSLNRI